MDILIRKARQEDAQVAVPLIMEAIGDISMQMTGETEEAAITKEFINLFTRTDNRHSYLYTYIAEMEGKVAGVLVFYSAEQVITLDANLEDYLSAKKGTTVKIDSETLPGEWYIDTVVVDPTYRGHGIGTKLLTFSEQLVAGFGGGSLSLNVETEKDAAIRLYNRLGFTTICPWTIIGEPFHHMVKTVGPHEGVE
ncbi:GNAT family N-acetyltransferase [Psychrobacillus sp.]|uniref:GNAT family N-acetyltransferase n=1 Tax=Psychrobacillus sp. TaxID=1871623 RepID=UPI0028BD914D|nr:GNAT family N-acetyltransferase [Psychrobacillus sp.]